MSDAWKPTAYCIRKGRAAGFKFTIEVGGKTEMVTFENNLYKCPSIEHEAAIEAVMGKAQLTQNIQKVDLNAGEAIARAHMEASGKSAAKGGMTSELAKNMENQIAASDVQALKAAYGAVDEAHESLKDDGLEIAETVVPSEVPTPDGNPAVKVEGSGGVALKIGK